MHRWRTLLTMAAALGCGADGGTHVDTTQTTGASPTETSETLPNTTAAVDPSTGGLPVDSTSGAGSSTGDPPASTSSESGSSGQLQCPAPIPVTEVAVLPQLDDDVARLSGEVAIEPGVLLQQRADAPSRAAARDYLAGRFDAMGLVGQLHEYGDNGANVYAELPATTDGSEWMLFGAHFDSVAAGPGAADNATGTAMVLAVAQYAATLACREQNVLFVLFDEEEIGLVGSQAFAAWMVEDGRDLTSVHTVDMVSWDSDDDRLFEIHRADGDLFEWYQAANDNAGLGMVLVQRDARSSDHTAFRNLGFTAVGLMEGWQSGDTTPHYHTAADTYDKIDFPYLEVSTRLVMQMVVDQVSPVAR